MIESVVAEKPAMLLFRARKVRLVVPSRYVKVAAPCPTKVALVRTVAMAAWVRALTAPSSRRLAAFT